MSTLNAALTYKLQKMEKTLSSLMEENRALRTIINEAGQSVYGGGGSYSGAEHGAALAQGPAASDAYLGNYTGLQAPEAQYGGRGVATSRTNLPTALNQRIGGGLAASALSGRQGTVAPGMGYAMSAPEVEAGGGAQSMPYDGAMLGALLAQAGQDGGAAANAYLNQYGFSLTPPVGVGGTQTAQDTRRGRGGSGVSRTR